MTYKIEKQIESYLNGNYPFALMINGKWGSGKTYYLKNVLEKNLEEISNGTLKSLCYISCNGVKSVDELKNNLTLSKFSSYTSLSESKLNIVKKFKDGIFTFLPDKLSGLVSIGLKDINLISKSDLIVIDDLERRHSNLTIEEILGFVSVFYTELNNTKVIIVADEEKLLDRLTAQEEKDKYLTIKEKTIYRTVEFDEDLSALLKSLIESKEDSEFKKFIQEKSEFILSRCNIYNEKNLRTLGFFLDTMKKLYKECYKELEDDTDNVIINTVLMLTIMYKKGANFFDKDTEKIHDYYKNTSHIVKMDWSEIVSSSSPKESDSITLEGDDFYNIFNEYLKQSRNLYNYFPSVLYLIGKDFWDEVQFRKEYDEYFKRYDKDLPWIKELEKFKDFRNFIDSEFEECLKNIANYIMADKYSVNKLHYIAYLFEQYQSAGIIGDFDVSSFYKKIEVSMNNRKDTALNRDYYFDSTMLKNSSNFFTDLNSQVEKLSKNELLKIHSDTMPKYLEEFFDTGEFEKQKFIEFLNAATESQIIMFCQYVLGSPKHIDTYCYNLSDHIDSFYMHNWGNRQNIEFVKKYLTENIKDTRIPKLRIEPLLAKIQ